MGLLAAFDAVLVLEDLDRGFDQVFHRLGWCKPDQVELRQTFGPGDRSITFSREQKAALAELNAPDAGLYHFARDLAKALTDGVPTKFRACRPKAQRRGGGRRAARGDASTRVEEAASRGPAGTPPTRRTRTCTARAPG